MKKSFISFMAGMAVGVVVGVLVGDEERNRIQKVLDKQVGRLRKEYERPIKASVAKMRRFVKEYLYS